jgi:hypothetical protein
LGPGTQDRRETGLSAPTQFSPQSEEPCTVGPCRIGSLLKAEFISRNLNYGVPPLVWLQKVAKAAKATSLHFWAGLQKDPYPYWTGLWVESASRRCLGPDFSARLGCPLANSAFGWLCRGVGRIFRGPLVSFRFGCGHCLCLWVALRLRLAKILISRGPVPEPSVIHGARHRDVEAAGSPGPLDPPTRVGPGTAGRALLQWLPAGLGRGRGGGARAAHRHRQGRPRWLQGENPWAGSPGEGEEGGPWREGSGHLFGFPEREAVGTRAVVALSPWGRDA